MRWLTLIAGCSLCLLWTSSALAAAPVDIETLIQNSVQATAADWKAAPNYDNCERDHQPGGGTRTYRVMMIAGSPYWRLVAVNGASLSPQDQAQEQQKLEAAIAQRRSESEQQRNSRIAKYQAESKRNQTLTEQLTKAFNFKMTGEQELNGYQVYVLDATPRPGYQPPNRDTQVLKGMRGTFWIDQKSFEWVKVEAHVIHPVSIEGFLAQVQPGTRFELEKAPVADNIWLPTHFAMNSRAKILLVFNYKSQGDWDYFDYLPADSANAQSAGCKEQK